jgi:putative ABC transport system permease protein
MAKGTRRLLPFLARLRGLLGRQPELEFDVELREHLRLLTERYVRQGMSREEAASAARRQFGNATRVQEDRRDLQTIPILESLWRDFRYAGRMLRKNPTFTAAIVLTVALGIGANTAIFSICNAVLLKPLPYAEPDRLVMLWERMGNGKLVTVAPANFVDWRSQSRSFSDVAAISPFSSLIMNGGPEPIRLAGAGVSWNFFSILGTPPVLGRGFLEEEDQPGSNQVAILSYGTWVDRFGARADVIGTPVMFNDATYVIVGVLPRDFEFVAKTFDHQIRNRFEVWVPLALNPKPSRGTHPLRVFARLKPGTSVEQAQADLDALGAHLAEAYPSDNKGRGIEAVPLRRQVTADARPALLTLLGAVGFVLAIACANVANLLLSRGASRQKETSLRLAIGATRARIAQQCLIESALLGLLGGCVGLVLAAWLLRIAVPYLPADLPRANEIGLDWRVLIFTASIALATGVLFGLAPLLQSRRVEATESLGHGSRLTGGLQHRLRSSLVVGQIAITLVLLVGAGLMAKTLWALLHVPTGFRSDHVLTARITLPRVRYPEAGRVAAFQRDLLERLRNTAGVQSAGAAAYLPLTGDDNGWAFFIEGRPPLPTGVYEVAKYRAVSDGYFDAIGTPIVQGRGFSAADKEDAPFVAVINESMAREFWKGEQPVGQRLRFGDPRWRTVIGIVGDVRHEGLDGAPLSEMYVPFAQAPNVERAARVVVRASIDPAAITPAVRAAVSAADASVPLDQVRTMDDILSSSVGQQHFKTLLLVALAMLALVMASVGIYGVINYAVVQRTRELGIYLAVGATTSDVLRLVLGGAARLIGVGLVLGLLASLALTRLIAGWLFGVTPLDFQIFAGVSLLLLAVACLASYIPARRATKIDPMIALRYE